MFTKPVPPKLEVSKLDMALIGALLILSIVGIYEYATFKPKYLFQYLPPPVDDQKLKAQGWEFDSEQTQGVPPVKIEVYRRLNDPPKN